MALQKENGNNHCCDCGAASPQWASPKFGIFICLECAGSHRALGVHISFVRSVTMDAFKPAEIERMRLGGNGRWKAFWAEHANADERGIPWEKDAIPRRYPGFLGEQYKESLSCEVEGKPFVLAERKEGDKAGAGGGSPEDSRSGTPLSGRREAPAGQGGRVKVDDQYFARLGADNAARRDDVPPNQGGKYAGFGSSPAPPPPTNAEGLPFEEWQKDSVAAITKGFGWFTNTVTRTAKNVNDGYIQPTASKVSPPPVPLQLAPIPQANSPSSPSRTLASKPSSPPRPSPAKRRSARATLTTASCASSRATGPAGGTRRRWTSRGRASGTTLRISGSGGRRGRARLGRRPWARGGRRRMSGIGDLYLDA